MEIFVVDFTKRQVAFDEIVLLKKTNCGCNLIADFGEEERVLPLFLTALTISLSLKIRIETASECSPSSLLTTFVDSR